MTKKMVTFVEITGMDAKTGFPIYKNLETSAVERCLRENYGFMELDDGFTQRVVDWYYEETDDTIMERAKRIIKHTAELECDEAVGLTIDQWLSLEATKYLLCEGEWYRTHKGE